MDIPKTVDELRTALIKSGVPEEVVAVSGKKKLQEMFASKHKPVENEDGFDIEYVPVEEYGGNNLLETTQELLPRYGSKEWQSYILSLIAPDEQLDGFPRCFGLRRVAQLVLGDIISSKPTQIVVIPQLSANDTPTRAVTVVYEIVFDWKMGNPIFVGADTPLQDYRTFGGMADCVEDINTPYGKHPAASAETKAESRALKKALCLNILSAEEKVSGYDEVIEMAPSNARITTQLASFIEAKVSALKLNLGDVMKEFGTSNEVLTNIPLEEGVKLFSYINGLQNKK